MRNGITGVSRLMALVFGVALQASAGTDYYASGFYTRGVDAATYVESEDAAFAPFYIPLQSHWLLLPRITVSSAYEDNATLNSGPSENATTVYAVPGLLLVYGHPGRNHLYTDAGLIIPLYRSSDRVDEKPSYMLAAGGMYRTGKSSIHARAGYRRLENVDTLVGARIVKQDYTGDLDLEHRLSTKSSAGLVGGVSFHDFEEDRYINYWRYYGGGRLYRRVTPKSDGYLQLGIGRDDLQGVHGRSGDADFYDVSVGMRGRQSVKTSVSGRIGYRWRRPVDDDLDDVNHYIASLNAETTPFGLTTFTGDLMADIRPSITDAGFATVDQRATAGVTRRLFSERLRGQASLFYGQVDYYGTEGRPVDIDDGRASEVYDGRGDEYWGYSLGLDWWLKHNFSVGVSYSYFENRGNRSGSEEERDRASYSSERWGLRASWNY